jgi:serine protease Do
VPPNRLLAVTAGAFLGAGALLAIGPRTGVAQNRARNPRSATVQRVFPSAVRLQIAAGGQVVRSASGVAFAREGDVTYVLTNAHVVEPGAGWKAPLDLRVLISGAKEPLAGRIVTKGRVPDLDIAVVAVDSSSIPLAPLGGDDSLELGDDLVVIGAPFGKGLSVAAGIVSQVEYASSDGGGAPRVPRSLKTDAAIGYGSSGGGVFDVPGGQLVGLVEGYRTARVAFGKDEGYTFDVPMPGETFVAPAAKIRRFLSERGFGRLAGVATAAVGPQHPQHPPITPARM